MRRALLTAAVLTAAAGAGELVRISTEPTAGIVAPGTYYFDMNTFPPAGLRFGIRAGIVPGLMAGVSYGGWDLVGMGDAEWFDRVSVNARFRFVGESRGFPALALGFDNEREPQRAGMDYRRLSRGVFLSASKNFELAGDLAFHGGISVSFDDPDHAGCWFGVDKSLPAGFGLALDWDPATNEDPSVRFDETGGFLNFEGFWQSFGQVRISFQFRDILEAGGDAYRAVGVDFLGLF